MTTLEKIRAEIDVIEINGQVDEHTAFIRTGEHVKQMALDIIDKYAEQEKDAYDKVLEYLKANVDDFPDYHEAIEAVLKMKGGE